jgi:hypothetical protein
VNNSVKGDVFMVRSIRLVGLAFVAMLALGAVMASAASATALIHFTKEGAFSGKGGEVEVETLAKTEILCSGANYKGSVITEDRLHILMEFLTCIIGEGEPCTTTEGGFEVGTRGNIHWLALALLGSDTAPPLDLPAVLLTPENKADEKANVTFKCSLGGLSLNLEVRGSLIGLALNVAAPSKCEILIHFNRAGTGMQQDTKFWSESETNVEGFLEFKSEGLLSFPFEDGGIAAEVSLQSGTNKILIET